MGLIADLLAAGPRVLRARRGLPGLRGDALAVRMAPVAVPQATDLGAARARHRAVARAARWVPGATCLVRAAALVDWLREDGQAARLRIGVRRDGRAPRAHAWVELAGHPLGEDAASIDAFAPLDQPPPDAAWPP